MELCAEAATGAQICRFRPASHRGVGVSAPYWSSPTTLTCRATRRVIGSASAHQMQCRVGGLNLRRTNVKRVNLLKYSNH